MSGSLKVELKFDAAGPLADGGAQDLVDAWVGNTTTALAAAGEEMLRAVKMDKSGRGQGGFQANLKTVSKSPGQATVASPNIEGVVWPAWLEGTSQRNDGNKFRGYHLFRKTRLALSKAAPAIGQAQLDALMPAIGGE